MTDVVKDELLTPVEVADMLKVTTKTLRVWSQTHKHRDLLAPYRLSAQCVRYQRSNVQKFLDKTLSVTSL